MTIMLRGAPDTDTRGGEYMLVGRTVCDEGISVDAKEKKERRERSGGRESKKERSFIFWQLFFFFSFMPPSIIVPQVE
jgi:hypothetical protein